MYLGCLKYLAFWAIGPEEFVSGFEKTSTWGGHFSRLDGMMLAREREAEEEEESEEEEEEQEEVEDEEESEQSRGGEDGRERIRKQYRTLIDTAISV